MLRAASCCLLLLALLVACSRSEPVETRVQQGALIGERRDGVDRYLVIPYAQPPLGRLRWAAPEPLESGWEGPRKATRFSAACVQGAKPSMAKGSSEDCLYLNVWAPAGAKGLPVMLWIHGGGQMLGSANEAAYEGEVLAREGNVVVVTINFRLSWLGFLAAGELAGNQGFLDQVMALRWVKQEIANFGGDPHRVTVFGESGGAVSTCLLLASPLTDGLMQRAIMQSGTCGIQPERSVAEARVQAQAFFEQIGCGDADDALACGGALDVAQVRERGFAPHSLLTMDSSSFSYYPLPVVDGHFLPQPSLALLADEKSKAVPVMVGTNRDEGTMFVGQLDLPADVEAYVVHLESLYPGQGAALAALYPFDAHEPIGAAYAAMFGDAMEHCPTRRAARLLAPRMPVYRYLFDQPSSAPALWLMRLFLWDRRAPQLGVYHGAELPYVFGVNSFAGRVGTGEQVATRDRVMHYWSQFAAQGDPNVAGLPVWPRWRDDRDVALRLAPSPGVAQDFRTRSCDYWDLHPKFSFW